ncbi:MAG: 2-oxoacid:acceptor oxidoreductase family protein [Acidaminococcus sp.]|jgi:2-oxoglutarate ferredoxin oxidoreductase subunit gamma|nr:2-oxoacid:acceptor oxidoreductase family protein [Acidaminococcus sp.]MCI2100692.1 2-oxoacid:acceptor oxidoreductase family protein [Acidaminococcus sp.]MCI2115013.1 2-oxoacid:acceptor oxidoreductase family protein [Acidaminococcus sp.]MCI2117043.1 2-oxoacid:acceptor oxidoreductase family protein [Acidaminococcus sp.]
MADRHYEMRFGGSGGQGMMLMGDVLAQAAGIKEGKEIILLKSYGPEARGGACRSELISDPKPINYPAIVRPDFVLAMSQQACDKYTDDMDAENGILLVDSGLVERVPESIKHVYRIPLTRIAKDETGRVITANVVALGAISVLSEIAGPDSVEAAVLNRFPKKVHPINIKAFEAGVAAAKALL